MTATAAAVRERQILFSGPMVRALLDGRKTQTRRVVKPQPVLHEGFWITPSETIPPLELLHMDDATLIRKTVTRCPYGAPGDRLWVRETCEIRGPRARGGEFFAPQREHPDGTFVCKYRADGGSLDYLGSWTPSIHMPRWASRISLEITDVRVQRLQEISYSDVLAEGIELDGSSLASPDDFAAFGALWDSLNAKRGYSLDSNPWVWTITFRRVEGE